MISKQSGILGVLLLSICIIVQAQGGSALVKLQSDISQTQKTNNLNFARFTFLKRGATFNELYDSLQRMKGYQFIATGLDNYAEKADCFLTNASIEDCIKFIESNYLISCIREGSLVMFSLRGATEGHENSKEKAPRYHVMQLVKVYDDGYHHIEKKNAAGAYLKPDSPLFRPNIVAHDLAQLLDGTIYRGVINNSDQFGYSFGSVRGTNTLGVNDKPTFVLGGFSFHHSLLLLNPYDLNMPTILLDAAAGAVQGSDASNGVFVTTPKKAESKGLSIHFINGVTLHFPKDLNYQSPLNADTLLELRRQGVEQLLFPNILKETPASVLWAQIRNPNTKDSALAALSQLSNNDLTKEIQKEYYQNRIDNQTYLSVGYARNAFKFYGSIGYNIAKMAEKGNEWQRVTSMLNGSYNKDKLYIELTAYGTLIKELKNHVPLSIRESYLSLYNPDGSEAEIPFKYPVTFTATINGDPFKYKPLEELRLANNRIDQRFYLLNSKVGYAVTRHIQLSMAGQYSYSDYDYLRIHDGQSFFTRDLAHQYKQPNGAGGYTYPITLDAIADRDYAVNKNYGFRPQIDGKFRGNNFEIRSFIAAEVKRYTMKAAANRRYGYNVSTPAAINFDTLYASFFDPNKKESIPNPVANVDSVNTFKSVLWSVLATYRDKYTASLKIRRDQSNRFSADMNDKGIYLWSVGTAWHIRNEAFLKDNKTITELTFRAGYGANGNIDFSMPPIQTIRSTSQPGVYTIDYPQTPNLGSEKLYILNFGVDFQISHWLKGRTDYYRKRASNLINNGNWNPITGFSYIRNNSGSIKGSGIEINLQSNTINLLNNLSYGVQILYSYATNKVTSKNVIKNPASSIVEQGLPVALEGYSADGLYAYKAAVLDANGEPQGYLDGSISTKYTEIRNSTNGSAITYIGSAVPKSVFHFSHRFCFKERFVFSFMFTGRLGYVTYVQGLNYYTLFNDLDGGTSDYYRRWKTPGDEDRITVPRLAFPLNKDRDLVYAYNETNFVQADNIRLQNLQMGYYWDNLKLSKLNCRRLDLIVSLNNVGILYKANRRGIDPDVAQGAYPNPRSISFSLNAQF